MGINDNPTLFAIASCLLKDDVYAEKCVTLVKARHARMQSVDLFKEKEAIKNACQAKLEPIEEEIERIMLFIKTCGASKPISSKIAKLLNEKAAIEKETIDAGMICAALETHLRNTNLKERENNS